ncbi:MAG TPA: carbohydrate ABC transporter permease [Acidimicrobiales bacterium]|nr:carbohydrate ABC transporter permease [Acidimicrobiales bacterium]
MASESTPGRRLGWYALLGALSLLVLLPVYFAFVRAVSDPTTILGGDALLVPKDVQSDVFQRAWRNGNLGGAMGRSLVVTVAITAAQVATSVLAAYAFAYLWFPFKRLVFALFMATLLLPLEVTVLPNLATISNLGWRNSFQGLIVPFLATALGTFLIRQAFLGVPSELRDAARLEGWTHWQLLTRLVVPLSRPVIAAFTLISFLGAYNQYLWPRIVTTRPDEWGTAPIAVRSLSSNPENANLIVAGGLLVALPMIVLLIFFQRHVVRGLTAGAVKG